MRNKKKGTLKISGHNRWPQKAFEPTYYRCVLAKMADNNSETVEVGSHYLHPQDCSKLALGVASSFWSQGRSRETAKLFS